MFKYKTIDTTTLKGLKQAERLQARGWKISRSGMFTVQMEKHFPRRTKRQGQTNHGGLR